MATSNTEKSMEIKLLIDRKEQRVLFAEAGKDFVDFVFTLLSMHVGSAVRVLLSSTSTGMVGSLGKLYKSIENLSDTCIQPTLNKKSFLNPNLSSLGVIVTRLLLPNDGLFAEKVYRCSRDASKSLCSRFVSDDPRAICPNCKFQISIETTYVAPPAATQEGGYVKGVVPYMIMDDLEVKLMSTISTITMLNSCNKNIADLEGKMVSVGKDIEGLKLLKASLVTRTVLTEVFLGESKLES